MTNLILTENDILLERDTFDDVKAGNSRLNYFLKGLTYKLTVQTKNVESVKLLVSETFDDFSTSFDFTDTGGGVFTYSEVAGTGATASSSDFKEGVKFYFRIQLIGEFDTTNVDRIFWIREPDNVILFETEQLVYITNFPVMVGSTSIPVDFAPDAKNGAGVKKRGGIVSVEVFTTPTAPSSGSHVTSIGETSVGSVNSIQLTDRTNLGTIPNFIAVPGNADYSNFFHYVTFRLRSKVGSANFKDVDIILFGSRKCKNATYGYDSSGEIKPKPIPVPLIPDDPPPPPPPDIPTQVCQSITNIPFKPEGPLNVYASKTTVQVFSEAVGGTLLSSGTGTPTSPTNLQIQRVDMSGPTSVPVTGYALVKQTGPDRTATSRTEITIFPCASIPIIITDLVIDEDTVTITITEESRDFDPTKTYEILLFDEKHGGTVIETFTPSEVTAREIKFIIDSEKSGFWAIKEDGNFITGSRIEKTVEPAPCLCISGTATHDHPTLGLENSFNHTVEPFLLNNRCQFTFRLDITNHLITIAYRLSGSTLFGKTLDQTAYWASSGSGPRVWKLVSPETTLDQPNGVYERLPGGGAAGDITLINFKSCPDGEGLP